MPAIKVAFNGATGAVGRELVPAILESQDFALVAALSRTRLGEDVGLVLGVGETGIVLRDDLRDAVRDTEAEVLIDFSSPLVSASVCILAIELGMSVVLGTTGLADDALLEIGKLASEHQVGVFSAPNLTVSGQLMFRCAELARPYFGSVEVIEGHLPTKADAPSGTANETAARLNQIVAPVPTADMTSVGPPEARGALIGQVRIHSVRLPGIYSHQEVLFGRPGELFAIRYEQTSNQPLVGPTLRAARLILGTRGLVYDLPAIFDPE